MNVKFNRRDILVIVGWTMLTIFENENIDWAHIKVSGLQEASWLIIANFLLQTLTWKKCKRDFASFFYVFIAFFYVFHFGQVLITGLYPAYKLDYLNYVKTFDLWVKTGAEMA